MENKRIESIARTLFAEHPTRFTTEEKDGFLRYVRSCLIEAGYSEQDVRIMQHAGMITSRNLIVGDPSAKYIVTAHYDTPGCNGFLLSSASLFGQTGANVVMLLACLPLCFLEGLLGGFLAASAISPPAAIALILLPVIALILLMFLPMMIKNKTNRNDNTSGVLGVLDCALRVLGNDELRSQCCFILFDNEEWGIIGSGQHAAWCKKTGVDLSGSLVINLDCIGVGDHLVAARTGKKTASMTEYLGRLAASETAMIEKRSVMVYMSDHANFKSAFMLSYMRRSRLGPLYIPNIHCKRDTECDVALVDGLVGSIVRSMDAH